MTIDLNTQLARSNKWGLSSLALLLGGFAVMAVCQRLFDNSRNACLVPLILMQLSALTTSLVASSRGSKAWLVVVAASGFLVYQSVLALLVE